MPSFQPFNVLDFNFFNNSASSEEPKKGIPPSRPPLPKKIPENVQQNNGECEMQERMTGLSASTPKSTNIITPISKQDLNVLKEKVVQDLLSTEIVYLFDLNVWESVEKLRFYVHLK